MPSWRRAVNLWRNLFRKARIEQELDEELRAYVELLTAENIRGGMGAAAARQAALLEVEGVEQVKEQVREVRAGAMLETIVQDLRYAVRVLAKNPGFAAVAVLTLALGIGANSAIFSVVNAVLLRPLPYPDSERLVLINHNYRKLDMKAAVSAPGYAYYREHARSFSAVAAVAGWNVNLTGDGEPERLQGMTVTPNLFPLLGAAAAHGRVLLEEEGQPGRNRVVVLSDALWRRRFGGDPTVLGRAVTLNGNPYTVVGVMPPTFQFGREIGPPADFWSPLAFTPQQLAPANLTNEYLSVLASLRPGVAIEQAQAEMDSIAGTLRGQYMPGSDETNWGLLLTPLGETVVGDIRPALLVLLGSVALVLLVACANVANLMLARAASRSKEIAIRAALGAGRLRVVRQLLTESAVIALLGGAAGLLVANWGLSFLLRVNGDRIPRAHEIALDWRVVAFTAGVSLLTGLVFGLGPAFQISRVDLQDTLKEGGRSGAAGTRRGVRGALVVAEVSLAVVLLVGAGLLVRSFVGLRQVSPGFRPEQVISMQVSLPFNRYREPQQRAAFYRQALESVAALPGVRAAGAVSALPMSGENMSSSFRIEGRPAPASEPLPHGDLWSATHDYFRAMNIPLARGRYFSERDTADSPGVAVVDESLARKYWPNEDPVGKRISFEGGAENPRWREVIGVVGHVKHGGLEGESRPQYYVPHAQNPGASMFVVAQADGDPSALAGPVRSAVRALDKDLPVYRVTTMERLVADSLSERRFSTLLLGAFAAVALLLAAVGLYGVLSYTVAQRRHEIGIRMALGARAGDVLRLVVGQGLWLTLAGLGLGLVAALALTRVMASLLYGVSALDPATFAGVALLLLVVALAACLVPAVRATKVDPTTALRAE
ncbi:MAG TPA: ABC transporter permease [Pyrinomonadaceae bacterium]